MRRLHRERLRRRLQAVPHGRLLRRAPRIMRSRSSGRSRTCLRRRRCLRPGPQCPWLLRRRHEGPRTPPRQPPTRPHMRPQPLRLRTRDRPRLCLRVLVRSRSSRNGRRFRSSAQTRPMCPSRSRAGQCISSLRTHRCARCASPPHGFVRSGRSSQRLRQGSTVRVRPCASTSCLRIRATRSRCTAAACCCMRGFRCQWRAQWSCSGSTSTMPRRRASPGPDRVTSRGAGTRSRSQG